MEIEQLENEISVLRQKLMDKECQLRKLKKNSKQNSLNKLTNEEIARYSRQIILPNIGVKGQLKLKNSSILIIGAGGLGCPAALYLVGAGIGKIGIIDYDEVEVNNLHRQLLHSEATLGLSKVGSAKEALLKINSNVEVIPYCIQLDSTNALEIIKNYDIVLDATDNVATRYLLNDACVLLNKPLVSGSALQLEGQLTVYNYANGPCYRCLFPKPPPPEAVVNCGDGGVIGAVTGIIGALQALESIKIVLKNDGILSERLLLFDGFNSTFRNVKLRGKRQNCDVCSDNPTIKTLIDYEQFCGMKANDKDSHLSILEAHERITVLEYNELLEKNEPHILIDVRTSIEYDICRLSSSINVPIKDIVDDKKNNLILNLIREKNVPVFIVCRRGNDSQIAVKYLQNTLKDCYVESKDLIGGLHAWKQIDINFPIY